MITKDNWPQKWSEVPAWTEISEEVYEHFFNVLPLLEWCGGYFQPTEAYTSAQDDKGRWRNKYLTFTKIGKKFWYLGVQFRGVYPERISDYRPEEEEK